MRVRKIIGRLVKPKLVAPPVIDLRRRAEAEKVNRFAAEYEHKRRARVARRADGHRASLRAPAEHVILEVSTGRLIRFRSPPKPQRRR